MTFYFDCDDGDVQRSSAQGVMFIRRAAGLPSASFGKRVRSNGDLAGIEATAGPADCAIRSRVIRDAS